MYPCPYCRHHLNEYVYLNKERDMYPIEYIFVGWEPSAANPTGDLSPGEKLNYVKDGRTLRLFVWKLHNAVNSSIHRSEKWYKSCDSIYTSRYWPNMKGTLYRATLKSGLVSAERMMKMVKLLKIASKLSS